MNIKKMASLIGLPLLLKVPNLMTLVIKPGEANSGYAHMLINTSSFEMNEAMTEKLDSFCFYTFPNADVVIGPLAGGGGGGADVEVRISGDSPEELFSDFRDGQTKDE